MTRLHHRSARHWHNHSLQEHQEIKREKTSGNVAFITAILLILAGFGLISVGVISLNANLSLFIGIALVVYLITLIKPLFGLAATIIAFSVSRDISVMGIPLRLEDFIIPALAVCWFLHGMKNKADLTPTPLKKPFIMIACIGLISTGFGLVLNLLSAAAAAQFYMKSIEYLVLFFVASNIMKTRDDVKLMFITLMVASAFVGLYGAWQALTQGHNSGFRVSGPYGETANILGGFYVFTMLLAAGMYFVVDSLKVKALILFYVAGIMFWPLLETLSRASFVSFLLAMSIIGLITKQRILLWVGLVMILIPLAFPEDIYDRIRTVLGVVGVEGYETPTSWADKILGWKALIYGRFLHFPILGTGVGSVSLQIDNEYMKVLGETGLIGLAAFFWMIRKAYDMAWSVWKGSKNQFDQGLALGFLGAMTALLIQGMSGTVFTTMRTMEPFIITCAMLSVILHIRNQERLEEPRHSGKHIDADSTVPPIGHYTVAELFRQRYRQSQS